MSFCLSPLSECLGYYEGQNIVSSRPQMVVGFAIKVIMSCSRSVCDFKLRSDCPNVPPFCSVNVGTSQLVKQCVEALL